MASTTERVENILFLGAEAFAKYRNIMDLQQRNQDNLALSELQTNLLPDLTSAVQTTSLDTLSNAEKTKFRINQLTANTMLQIRQNPAYNPRLEDSLKTFVSKFYTQGLTSKMSSIIQSPEDTAITILQQGNNDILNSLVQGKSDLASSIQTLYGNLDNAQSFITPERLSKLAKSSISDLFSVALERADRTNPQAAQEILLLSSQFNDPAAHNKIEKKALDIINKATQENFLKAYNDIINGTQSLPAAAFNNSDLVDLFQFVQETRALSPAEIRTASAESSSELVRKGGDERASIVEYQMLNDSATFLASQGIYEQPLANYSNSAALQNFLEEGNQKITQLSSIAPFSTFLTKANRDNLKIFLENAPVAEHITALQTMINSASDQLRPVLVNDVSSVDSLAGGLMEVLSMLPLDASQLAKAYQLNVETKPTFDRQDDPRIIPNLLYAYPDNPQIGAALATFYRQSDNRGMKNILSQIKSLSQGNSNALMPDFKINRTLASWFQNSASPISMLQRIINKDIQNIYRIFDNGQKIYTREQNRVEVSSLRDLSSYINFAGLGGGVYKMIIKGPTIITTELEYDDGTPVIFTINDYEKLNLNFNKP